MGVTSIRLQPEIETPLEELANKLDRSKNYIINQAIKEFIERQSIEDIRWSQTLEALDSIKDASSLSEDEVRVWLESWGTDKELSPPGE